MVHSFPHIGTKLMCPYNVVLGSSPSRKVKSPWSIPQRLPRHVAAADSAEKVDNHATPVSISYKELMVYKQVNVLILAFQTIQIAKNENFVVASGLN